MYSVDLYARVRRACHVDGMSERAAARHFGIDRKTVSKILKHSIPPGYQRSGSPSRPMLDGFTGIIDQILTDDKRVIKKLGQFLTARYGSVSKSKIKIGGLAEAKAAFEGMQRGLYSE